MKQFHHFIWLCLYLIACEPTTTEIANWQNEAEAQRKLLEKAQVRTLDIFNVTINGDTLPQRQHIAFNDYGEKILSEEQGVLKPTTIKYTYTTNHQVSHEKHYQHNTLIRQVQHEYGASGKLISSVATSSQEEVKKLLTYDSDGRLQSVKETAHDKMSDNQLLYEISTVYVYEGSLCSEQKEVRTNAQGDTLEQLRYQYDYNARGRLIRRREYLQERLTSETHWEYNQNGQAKYTAYYIFDELGNKVLSFQKKYRYSKDGLCLQITTGNATGNVLEQQFYEYQYLNNK